MAIRLALAACALLVFLVVGLDASGDCEQTEYLAYRDCVHAANAARHKRQSPAANLQLTANHTLPAVAIAAAANVSLPYLAANSSGTFNTTRHCQRLNFDCRIACRNETVCESRCPVCPLTADQLPAAANLRADGGDYRTVVIERADGGFERFRARIEPGRNITTIIRLTNILNNTNHIHIPTNVTTNNVNNVNLHANHTVGGAGSQTGGEFGLGYSEAGGACCYVVQPRTCRTSSTAGRRCHNQRRRQCDDRICKARVMLVQTRRRCNRAGTDCKKRLVYVPEPGAPKCVRIPRWPFVVCGPVVSRAQSEALRHRLPPPPPPPMVPAWDPYYYGSYGPDYGQYGQQQQYHHQQHRQPAAGHHGPGRDVYYEDEVVVDGDELAGGAAENGTDSGEWLPEDAKCKVVSANGSVVEIRNCTAGGLDENEFATEPKVNFARDAEEGDEEDEDFRPKRHAAYYEEAEGVQQRSNRRRRRHHRRPHLDYNYEDDYEDERYMQQLPNNRIAEDFEYDEELDHPYKRPNRRKGRRGGRRGRGGHGGRRHQRIVYDEEEEEVVEQKVAATK